MRGDLHLFIGGKEVEFSAPPEILYNYQETDFSNPTVVKNSFSKTITIEGTNGNNDLFGNIWNLERIQSYGTGTYSGTYFNPLQKADFTIYLNGEIYESGYVKLDTVKKSGNKIEYSITLFGGLGSFFYNLTYSHNSEGVVEGPNKLKLSDLSFASEEYGEPNFDFTMNKDALWDAWETIMGVGPQEACYTEDELEEMGGRPSHYLYDRKWTMLNFAPCYNGIPSDFDPSKMLINKKGLESDFTWSASGYTAVNGFALGETEEELTEWETKDLRSYLQRPVFKMQNIIEACCNPVNNGGFEVQLDSHFFDTSSDTYNPFYEDTWVTLPMLRNLVEGGETVTSKNATLTAKSGTTNFLSIVPQGVTTMSDYTNLSMGLLIKFTPSSAVSGDYLYSSYQYSGNRSKRGNAQRVKYYKRNGAFIAQVLAYDASSTLVGASNAYYLSTQGSNLQADYTMFKEHYEKLAGGTPPSIKYVEGLYKKDSNGKFVFSDLNGNQMALGFTLVTKTPFDHLELKVFPVSRLEECYRNPDSFLHWEGDTTHTQGYGTLYMYTNPYVYYNGNKTLAEVYDLGGQTNGSFSYEAVDFNLIGEDIDAMFSNTRITKEKLLSSELTPCDYLLSYCKMFGLYFFKDPSEMASDPQKCPNGVIHIMDRDSFYNRNEVMNIEKMIDRSKEMLITPQIAETKWYDFNVEQVESEANEEYKSKFGTDYGLKRINTGYNFDADKKDLLEDNAFKGGVQVLEQSKYYNNAVQGLPPYVWNGMKYSLFKLNGDNGYDSTDIDHEVQTMYDLPINADGMKNTDSMDKPQFHGKDNDPVEGDNVLLFYRRQRRMQNPDGNNVDYWITDDINEMKTLNDSTPCWIMTANEKDMSGKYIAYRANYLPYFSRFTDYSETGMIINNLDMGTPQETYVINKFVTEPMSIYDRCWKNYIADLYDVNTKKLTCYCLLEERPNPDWLRRFYWFDNSIWRLNKITDWNISSYETTKMEFVKVQDRSNYALAKLTSYGTTTLTFEEDVVDDGSQMVYGNITLQDGGFWAFPDWGTYKYSDGTSEAFPLYGDPTESWIQPASGHGNTRLAFSIPENTTSMDRTFTIKLNSNYPEFRGIEATIVQRGKKSMTLTPEDLDVPAEGGTYEIDVHYQNRGDDNVLFDHNENYDYLDWSLSEWNGDHATLTVTVAPNNTGAVRREDYISVEAMYGGVSAVLGVVQSGTYLKITPSAMEVSNYGEVFLEDILTNADSWNYTKSDDWITLDNFEEDKVRVTVSQNPEGYTGLTRTGYIDFYAEDAQGNRSTKRLLITQKQLENTKIYITANTELTEVPADFVLAKDSQGNELTCTIQALGGQEYVIEFNGRAKYMSFGDVKHTTHSKTTTVTGIYGLNHKVTLGAPSSYSGYTYWTRFEDITHLSYISLNNFEPLNNSMHRLFNPCRELTTIEWGNFSTSGVTNMDALFYNCNSLRSIDLSTFDTSNVTDMNSMFGACVSLQSLDLSGFDTSNVTDIDSMFIYCHSLTQLKIGPLCHVSEDVDFTGVPSGGLLYYPSGMTDYQHWLPDGWIAVPY